MDASGLSGDVKVYLLNKLDGGAKIIKDDKLKQAKDKLDKYRIPAATTNEMVAKVNDIGNQYFRSSEDDAVGAFKALCNLSSIDTLKNAIKELRFSVNGSSPPAKTLNPKL